MTRHYGMDWLRVGAFAILILYHIGMVFVPWPFHAKSTHVEPWALVPMLSVNAWRLTLLFVVSGYATRALLGRSHGLRAFVRNRSARLLVPLAFGIVAIVPPQSWVELATQHRYPGGFASFWLHDYFRFGRLAGLLLPAWNHLWFVLYLWVYTMLLALSVAVARPLRWQHGYNRVFGGARVLLLPLAWFVCIHAWWFPMAAETHALVDDGMAHAEYLPAFLFGFGLARSERVMAAVIRWHRPAGIAAVAGYAWIAAAQLGQAPTAGDWTRVYGAAHAVQQWGGIVALIGFAERHWNRDAPVRRTLTEAVFPFYLIHQTIIVVVAGWLLGARLGAAAEFTIILAATIAGCWIFYRGGRALPWARPLIGLRRHLPARGSSSKASVL